MIGDRNKIRSQYLAGIISEDIKLVPSNQGRSEPGTLGYYMEEYIIRLSERIITTLDQTLQKDRFVLSISQGGTKMAENSFTAKLLVKNLGQNTKDFILNILVNLNDSANTAVSVTSDGMTDKFNLNSNHTAADVDKLIQEINNRIYNSLRSVR